MESSSHGVGGMVRTKNFHRAMVVGEELKKTKGDEGVWWRETIRLFQNEKRTRQPQEADRKLWRKKKDRSRGVEIRDRWSSEADTSLLDCTGRPLYSSSCSISYFLRENLQTIFLSVFSAHDLSPVFLCDAGEQMMRTWLTTRDWPPPGRDLAVVASIAAVVVAVVAARENAAG